MRSQSTSKFDVILSYYFGFFFNMDTKPNTNNIHTFRVKEIKLEYNKLPLNKIE